MASFTLNTSRFPDGTALGAYDAQGIAEFPSTGPHSPAVATAAMAGTEATFDGLAENTGYFAAAEIEGAWRSVSFRTGQRTTASEVVTSDAAGGDLVNRRGERIGLPTFTELQGKADLEDGKLVESQLPDSVVETAEDALLASTSIGRRLLRKLFEGLEDCSILVVGDSTSQDYTGWVGKFFDGLAAAFPAATFRYRKWSTTENAYEAAVTKHTGTGPRTITLWNCAVAQKNAWFQMAPYFDQMIGQVQPDLIFFSHGHNHGSAIYAPEPYFRDSITVVTQTITQACPLAELVLLAQNPRTDANAEVQARRQHVVEELAQLRGYGFVNLWRLFYEEGRNPAEFLEPEGVHPTQAGYTLIAKRVLERMRLDGRLSSQQPSSFLVSASSYLINGDFSSFASPPTLTGWTAVNATLSKDTANYEAPNGYAVKIATVSEETGAYMWQPIAGDALRALRGGWVTFAARIRVPAAQEIPEAGRISIIEAGGSNPGNQPSDNLTIPGNGQGGFRWNMVSRRLAADCTSAQFYVLCSSAGTKGEVTVDRVAVTRGVLPKDIRA